MYIYVYLNLDLLGDQYLCIERALSRIKTEQTNKQNLACLVRLYSGGQWTIAEAKLESSLCIEIYRTFPFPLCYLIPRLNECNHYGWSDPEQCSHSTDLGVICDVPLNYDGKYCLLIYQLGSGSKCYLMISFHIKN